MSTRKYIFLSYAPCVYRYKEEYSVRRKRIARGHALFYISLGNKGVPNPFYRCLWVKEYSLPPPRHTNTHMLNFLFTL